ncbi:MAG: nuclease, partial [Ruminococcus flavefaciens]|nr:nuclease [Ruminococcus flavefaciens]
MEDMRQESLKEGIKEGAINTAKKMLADGTIALEKIAEFVELPVDEVMNLKLQ